MAQKIKATQRFFAPEITKIYWLATVANLATGPTRAELTAALDLTDEVADISGWSTTSSTIDTPDLGTRFTGKVGGRTSAGDSSITFHGSRDGDDIRQDLSEDLPGFIWIADGGDVEDFLADLFPVSVLSIGKLRAVDGKNFQITVPFSISRKPVENLKIPALA